MTDKFVSWRRSAVLNSAERDETGRLSANLQVTLTDSEASPAASGGVRVRFKSAADVASLTRRAVRRRLPAPGSTDAETTKRTHVDFGDADFCWRYTPETVNPQGQLRPWLALVVGTTDELRVDGSLVAATPGVLKQYRLTQSWRWAHVHQAGGGFSRLMSPHPGLRALTNYVAVLVPAFTDQGTDAWDADGNLAPGLQLRALDSWRFSTGEGGDFETLAAQLKMPPAHDLGRAQLHYRVGGQQTGPVDVRGALQSLAEVQPATPPEMDLLAGQMALAARDAAGPERLGLPHYGLPWVAEPWSHTTGWVQQLREDLRLRIHAGTGVWCGVEAQDELMRAAVEQAGALADAAARIAWTAAGVAASGSLWRRNLPADPTARLSVLGPLTTRMLADSGSFDAPAVTVADAVTGADRNLDRALFTSAGRRLLGRPDRVHRKPVASASELLAAANAGPTGRPPGWDQLEQAWIEWGAMNGQDGLVLLDPLARGLAELATQWAGLHAAFVRLLPPALRPVDPEAYDHRADEYVREKVEDLQDQPIQDYFGELPLDCDLREMVEDVTGESWDWLLGRVIRWGDAAAQVYGPVQRAVLRCLLHCWERHEPDEQPPECTMWIEVLRIPAPATLNPVWLPGLGGNLVKAVDPRNERAPARLHLEEEVSGLPVDSLAPPRYPLGLDFPTWIILRDHEPDWFLPGSQSVAMHTLTALRTNPAFIDAFLVGLNSQFLSEARWRGLQADRWATPLRMFFGPAEPASGKRGPDIIPIGEWTDDSPLGHRSHQADASVPGATTSAERLVLLFHTPLFRRYPGTVVYLQRRLDDDDLQELALQEGPQDLRPPEGGDLATWLTNRTHIAATFRGDITPDLVFFVFDIAPTDLDEYLVVLDEPPSEVRFRNDLGVQLDTSAGQAAKDIDPQTRMAIDGAHLKHQGRSE